MRYELQPTGRNSDDSNGAAFSKTALSKHFLSTGERRYAAARLAQNCCVEQKRKSRYEERPNP